jgi:hypothetical protein
LHAAGLKEQAVTQLCREAPLSAAEKGLTNKCG